MSRYNYTKLVFKIKDLKFSEFVKDHIKLNLITDQQHKFLLKHDGKIGVNQVIRFENLEKELKEISNKIDINLDNFKRMNSSTFDDYKEYYNDETKNLVKNYCKEDLKYFNYVF